MSLSLVNKRTMNKVTGKILRVFVLDHQVMVPPSDVYLNHLLYSDFRLERMLDIPAFVQECMNTDLPAATVKKIGGCRGQIECEDWFKPYTKDFDRLLNTNLDFLKQFELCLESQSFFKALNALEHPPHLYGLLEFSRKNGSFDTLNQRIKLVNEFTSLIRQDMNSQSMRRAIKYREDQNKANVMSCELLVGKLFQKHGQLWVLPVDFAYTPFQQDLQHNDPTDLEQEFHGPHRLELLKQQIAQFLENRRRNKTLKQIVGYLFCFGHSLKKGVFVKVIFFLDGNTCDQAENYVKYLSQYWSRLTNRQGCTYFCNGDSSQSPAMGIRLIKKTDEEQRDNLMLIIQYYCQLERFFRLKYLGENSFKQLQMSQPPVINKGKVKASGLNQNLNVKKGK